MRPAKLSVGTVLWLAGWCLLAAGQKDPCSTQAGSENCPRPTKSATLLPSFTKTPTAPQKHTTTHHHRRHTTTTRHPATTTTPKKPTTTTPHAATTTTTAHHPTSHQHTTAHQKHTTSHAAATTTAHHPTSHQRTTAHQKYTTGRHPATTPASHTSAHHPTTVPRPTQPPAVLVGNYTVKEGAGVCLRAEMGLQLRIRYAEKAKWQVWGTFTVQPKHTNVSGTCSNKTATLELQFPEGFILFTFQKNETEKIAYLSQVEVNLTYQFPQATERTFGVNNASLREFAAPLGKSYQCSNRSLALSKNVRLTALSEHLQAFELRDGKFGEAEVCPEEKRSIVLPIVVAVVLVLLILVVLVAFAVGRRRSRTGYESL